MSKKNPEDGWLFEEMKPEDPTPEFKNAPVSKGFVSASKGKEDWRAQGRKNCPKCGVEMYEGHTH